MIAIGHYVDTVARSFSCKTEYTILVDPVLVLFFILFFLPFNQVPPPPLLGDSTSRALHYFSNLEDKKWAYKKSMRELLILLIESESQHIELQDKICC